MIKKKWFLRWALFMSLTFVAAVIAGLRGVFGLVWKFDTSNISFLILGMFVYASLRLGALTWRFEKIVEKLGGKKPGPDDARELKEFGYGFENCKTVNGYCQLLGFFGTLWGLSGLMVSGFQGLTRSDTAAIDRLLAMMPVGLGTALFTSIAGVFCYMVLTLQIKHLERGLERLDDETL